MLTYKPGSGSNKAESESANAVYLQEGLASPLASEMSQVSLKMHSLCRARHFTNSSRKAENAIVNASASRLRILDTRMTAKPLSS